MKLHSLTLPVISAKSEKTGIPESLKIKSHFSGTLFIYKGNQISGLGLMSDFILN